MAEGKNLDEIGLEILETARNELYLNLPYLGPALGGLGLQPGNNVTATAATDGETLYYTGSFLADRYLRSGVLVNRLYLHVILHCMLRHLAKKQGREGVLWDLSCDAAVESILDGLEYPCLGGGYSPSKEKFYGECRREMTVLTAEGIYRRLLRLRLPEYELAMLQKTFLQDDHGLWDPKRREEKERSRRQDRMWRGVSEKTRTGMETVLAGRASGGEAVYQQVRVANREDVDYRAFLRRFAAPREIMAVDGDAFDYGFYAYGLRLYGNMPLVEPPETREERRIEDFVIAVDTSMSTSGALVRQFLSSTYAILRSTETFTRKVNIRILQCDDQVRSDVILRDLDGLKDYMEHFQLAGGSATDFRPVFEHVARLCSEGELTDLRGLVYFTDGMGIYPEKRPPYDVAFIMIEEPSASAVEVPPWAIALRLTEPELERAAGSGDDPEEPDLRDLPEL